MYDHDAAGNNSLTFYADDGIVTLTAGTTWDWTATVGLDDITLGWNKWDGEGVNLTLTNFKVWKRALSTSQLEDEKEVNVVKDKTDLWAHWPLFDSSYLSDYSGNNRTLTKVLSGTGSTCTDGSMVVTDLGGVLSSDLECLESTSTADLTGGQVATADGSTTEVTLLDSGALLRSTDSVATAVLVGTPTSLTADGEATAVLVGTPTSLTADGVAKEIVNSSKNKKVGDNFRFSYKDEHKHKLEDGTEETPKEDKTEK